MLIRFVSLLHTILTNLLDKQNREKESGVSSMTVDYADVPILVVLNKAWELARIGMISSKHQGFHTAIIGGADTVSYSDTLKQYKKSERSEPYGTP